MTLTQAQLFTLQADMLADPNIVASANAGAWSPIQNMYSAVVVPPQWVWRTSVDKRELVERVSRTGTSFTWAGNGFISRSAGELECWNQLFNSRLTCNPSLPNVRQAFIDIFSGIGNAASNRAHLDAVSRRQANRAERLFATGAGLDTNAGAATMTFEGVLSVEDLLAAWGL